MTDLGPCCICETRYGVTNVVMLNRRGVEGVGWGCVVCGLPMAGAVIVLCDGCRELFEAGAPPLFAFGGPDKRVPFDQLPDEPFDHDAAKHREDDAAWSR
jgi:hypothetical protein